MTSFGANKLNTQKPNRTLLGTLAIKIIARLLQTLQTWFLTLHFLSDILKSKDFAESGTS
ncbi:MAG: hypothetical protein SCALA701_09470 [Candidatus Scalindua sp.]|nr:MAG: hypothetical protein SCALA701_09470 [Candidatus Scalindua sp.]